MPLDFPNSPAVNDTWIASNGVTYVWTGTMWAVQAGSGGTVVSSFNSRTGAVTLLTADVTGAGGAPLASPTFTGTPSLPTGTAGVTQTAGNSTTALATTAFVATAMAAETANIVSNTNAIDNSGFAVNQRGYTSGSALAAAAFGFDRWKGGASGATLTFSASPASTVVTITAGSLQQVVEGGGLLTGSYTLSWTGTAQGRIGAGSYAASPVAVSATAGTNLTVEFNTGTLSRVKLEWGASATVWQPLPPQQELARCQRFYAIVSAHGLITATAASQFVVGTAVFPVTMRAAPTLLVLSTIGTDSNISGTPTGDNVTTTGGRLYAQSVAAGQANWSRNISAAADL